MRKKIGVLHLVDSLALGGTEHMAVQLANNLPKNDYSAYLCATRQGGPLQAQIQPHVRFLELHRRSMLDFSAIFCLSRFISQENIKIIHAHTTSLFLGEVLCTLNPHLRLVWHDHAGFQSMQSRSIIIYKFLVHRAASIFTVTRHLQIWVVKTLGIKKERVIYLPNFIEEKESLPTFLDLPGQKGKRIVCVANIRLPKDHLSLIHAMVEVIRFDPQTHLLIVGEIVDTSLAEDIREEIQRQGLANHITFLGQRKDVPTILANCDIGVLSSISEGFPVALLEYGQAGLGVVATKVGECAEIMEEGSAGILVPPSDPDNLAKAIICLLESNSLRMEYGRKLKQRILQNYTAEIIEKRVCLVYERILKKDSLP